MTAAAHSTYLRKLARETDRTRLVRARAAVREARSHKRTARQRARKLCERARIAFRRWRSRSRVELKKQIAALRAELVTTTARRRARVQACCGRSARARARAAGDAAIAKARGELAQLLDERKRERTWSGRGVLRPAPLKARERAQESDHAVEVNLTPDQLTVWRKVKAQIHGSARMSRTEAFEHWLHDHSADVGRILAQDAEEAYQRAVRDEVKERGRGRSKRSDAQLASYVAAELGRGAVPF
jgi:DNA-binding protein H-NS